MEFAIHGAEVCVLFLFVYLFISFLPCFVRHLSPSALILACIFALIDLSFNLTSAYDIVKEMLLAILSICSIEELMDSDSDSDLDSEAEVSLEARRQIIESKRILWLLRFVFSSSLNFIFFLVLFIDTIIHCPSYFVLEPICFYFAMARQ